MGFVHSNTIPPSRMREESGDIASPLILLLWIIIATAAVAIKSHRLDRGFDVNQGVQLLGGCGADIHQGLNSSKIVNHIRVHVAAPVNLSG